MNLDKIYQQTILDYSSRKDLKKELDNPDFKERGHNPNCGDDLTLEVKLDGDIVKEASFVGNGCAISSASTAMLIDRVKGKNIKDAKHIVETFFKMMNINREEPLTDEEENLLGDAILLEYVSKMPARVKCATLSWHSMKVIIDKVDK